MNLAETVEALESLNIQIGMDLGVHQGCLIESNCPVAVELRRIISETNIPMADILTAHGEITSNPPNSPSSLNFTLPEVSGIVNVSVGGSTASIDVSDYIREQVERTLSFHIQRIGEAEGQLRRAGNSFFHEYLRSIDTAKKSKELLVPRFSLEQLMRYKCMISTDGSDYLYIFLVHYNPQWVYSDGIRCKLHPEHVKSLERNIGIVFPITSSGSIRTVYSIDEKGSKFSHYHGRAGDCWGNVTLPPRWDGSLRQLGLIAKKMEGALATVNADSPMQTHPPGMPSIGTLIEEGTELGREGVMESPPVEVTLVDVANANDVDEGEETPRGWGARRRR
jgi:hypothetical protein